MLKDGANEILIASILANQKYPRFIKTEFKI